MRVAHTQRQGGTALIIAMGLWLVANKVYKPQDVACNQTIFIEGVPAKFKNEQIKTLLRVMVRQHMRDKLFIIAECDKLFPPRRWHEKEQTEALIGVQQDEKLGNTILYDCHLRGVDVLLDSATQIEIIPEYRPALDRIDCEITWLHDMRPHVSVMVEHVSETIFPYYLTGEPVE